MTRINALAEERQEAWATEHDLDPDEYQRVVETGQRDLTQVLTSRLDHSFAEMRQDEAGE